MSELAQGRWTIRAIVAARSEHRLREEFTPSDVNHALGITYAGTFLPKHRVGNSGHYTEHFVRLRPGVYRLR
jgi:hypothetical protein